MEEGSELPAVTRLVTQERIERYAEASGDFNPIHVDPAYAAATQFGGTIAHGMMVAAMVSESMARAFALDWYETGKLKLRFRAPVRPGETVTASGKVRSVRMSGDARELRCLVGVHKADGEAAITGEAVVSIRPGQAPA